MSIFGELKRRNVFRVALIYLAGAWLILQIGDVVFPVLDVPAWSLRLLLGLLGLGFPIAVLLAWTFDITPEGIRRDPGSEAIAAPTRKNVRRLDFAIIGMLSLAVVFLLLNRGDGGDDQRIAGVSAIAVLPLQLLNADSDKEYLAAGMTMSLINELSKIEALRVISRTSVQKFKNTQLSLPEIAAALNVDVIIEGTVLSSGDQIRISANLVHADSDSPAWSEVYDDNLGDVLAMQTKIARAVAGQVSITLTAADEARLIVQPAVDAKVQDLIFKGRHLVTTTHGREGREMLEAATLLAPDYAPAWIALGYAYRSWSNDDPAYLERAREALQKAMLLDPNNDDAQYLAGSIALYNDWDWPLAIESLSRVLELNPGHDRALQALGDYYEMLGQYDESIAFGIRSVESNPASSSMYMNLGLTYEYAGMNQEALEACEMGAALSHDSAWVAICLAEVHAAIGNSAKATEMADKAVNHYLSEDLVLGLAAIAYGKVGEKDKAEEVRAHLVRQSENRFVSPMALSYGAFATNDLDDFFDLLKQAIDLKIPFSPWVATVPHFADIRGDPRMQPIIDSLNLPIH